MQDFRWYDFGLLCLIIVGVVVGVCFLAFNLSALQAHGHAVAALALFAGMVGVDLNGRSAGRQHRARSSGERRQGDREPEPDGGGGHLIARCKAWLTARGLFHGHYLGLALIMVWRSWCC